MINYNNTLQQHITTINYNDTLQRYITTFENSFTKEKKSAHLGLKLLWDCVGRHRWYCTYLKIAGQAPERLPAKQHGAVFFAQILSVCPSRTRSAPSISVLRKNKHWRHFF
jgi:hypothetical protein